MTIRRLLCASAIIAPAAFILPSHHASRDVLSAQEVSAAPSSPPASWDDADPADSLYRKAREALNSSDFRKAANMFADIAARFPKSTYAADALYWRAYSLYSIGRDTDLRDALSALEAQKARYPKASTIGESKTLSIRISGALARRGDATAAVAVSSAATRQSPCPKGDIRDDDNDLRMAAMNALLQMESEQALPILKEVLQKRDACSAPLRRKAMFLLSQKPSPEAERLLIDAVKSDPDHDVREQAVFWLGQVHTDHAAAALEELLTSSPDMDIRAKAVFSLEQQNSPRAAALLRRVAESADTPANVRERAIFSLGQTHSADNNTFLRTLFSRMGKGDRDDETRKKILFSLSQMQGMGNDKWLLGLALDNSLSEEVRKHALFCAGQAGVSGTDLVSLYDRLPESGLKEHLIWILSESRDRAAGDKLVEIVKHDKDPEMRKKAMFWLSQKNDPRVKQLLLDIIKG
ncbi:MAG: HEAT repeat domain-containing protein [bacterium]